MELPRESVQSRLDRLEAPIIHEFCRPVTSRVSYVDFLGACLGLPDTGQPVALGGETAPPKSKNALKRERARERGSKTDLCTPFSLGRCVHGDTCRFNHDVVSYLSNKPPDLQGQCPFSKEKCCPHGVTCRWAGTHHNPDALESEFLSHLKKDAPAAHGAVVASKQEELAAVNAITSSDPKESKDIPDEGLVQFSVTMPKTGKQEAEGARWWWHQDDSIPIDAFSMVPFASPVLQSVNTLSKSVQLQLRKNEYDFSVADAALAALGIRNTSKRRDKWDSSAKINAVKSVGEGDGGSGFQELKIVSAALISEDGVHPPSPKRQRAAPESNRTLQIAQDVAIDDPPVVVKEGGETRADLTIERRSGKRSIDFRGKTFLAPLTTVGNLPFRRLCKTLGADITCGEMALATNLLQGQASEWALLRRHPSEDCFGVQVCGGYGDSMTRCAQLIEDLATVDFVDVNFGCPIDVITQRGAGSACLLRPNRMGEIIRGMSSILTCPLTLKMRKGYHDGSDVAHEIVPHLAGWGGVAVTLHGRTREQRYSRPADWEYIKRCVEAAAPTGLQVVGNGDVMSWREHERAVNEAGVATTYVARGALIKPWIFTEIKEKRDWDISGGERLEIIRKFASHGLEHWGSDERGVTTTRKFLLEWLSFAHRYIPVGLLEVVPQAINWRPPAFVGRNDLETLLASPDPRDWIRISELVLGPAPPRFRFTPKHKATSYGPPSLGKGATTEQENG